ncbi:MAG: thermonuclease family protein [Mesorhizobium sp.]
MKARAALAILLLAGFTLPASADEPASGTATMRDAVTVAMGGARYRLQGINPPKDGVACGERPCLDAAMDELTRVISGQQITCTKRQRLGHGFFLSTCKLADGTDVGKHLLEQGLATVETDASAAYRTAAEQAQAASKGLWAKAAN